VGDKSTDLLQGTLDLMVLRVLSLEPIHGWGIGERLAELSGEVFVVNQGSIYPALQRMRRKGWITAEWRRSANNRRARYYALTAAGERRLREEVGEWRRTSAAVDRVLGMAPSGA
jgi:PadR family transcriptional regulator, regulatory protein PadR